MKFEFEVTRTYVFKGSVCIEADSEVEAKEKAFDMIGDTNLSISYAIDGEDRVNGDTYADFLVSLNIDQLNINTLQEWANSYGYFFRYHKNNAFEKDTYNCYLKKDGMSEDKCIKAFIYGSEFDAVEAAAKWLFNTYKKIKTYPVLIEKGV